MLDNTRIPQHLLDDPSMVFTMGSTGIFGYCGLAKHDPNKILYWSMYDTDLPARGKEADLKLLTQQLHARHSDWHDPTIQTCLAHAQPDNIWPIFVMPELPRWGRDGCVLIGDAAHALPPKTGQGSSQAFEDAQTLALLLAAHLERGETEDAVDCSIAALHELRAPRVYRMRSKALAQREPRMPMSRAMTLVMYAAIFLSLIHI